MEGRHASTTTTCSSSTSTTTGATTSTTTTTETGSSAESCRSLLKNYEGKCDWLNDDKFLRDLEADSIDCDVIEEELRSLQAHEPHTGKVHKGLESNPLQIAMCVLVLIDAGVVIAEMLLELNAMRTQSREATSDLNETLSFLNEHFSEELRMSRLWDQQWGEQWEGKWEGENVRDILKRIRQQLEYPSTPHQLLSPSQTGGTEDFAATRAYEKVVETGDSVDKATELNRPLYEAVGSNTTFDKSADNDEVIDKAVGTDQSFDKAVETEKLDKKDRNSGAHQSDTTEEVFLSSSSSSSLPSEQPTTSSSSSFVVVVDTNLLRHGRRRRCHHGHLTINHKNESESRTCRKRRDTRGRVSQTVENSNSLDESSDSSRVGGVAYPDVVASPKVAGSPVGGTLFPTINTNFGSPTSEKGVISNKMSDDNDDEVVVVMQKGHGVTPDVPRKRAQDHGVTPDVMRRRAQGHGVRLDVTSKRVDSAGERGERKGGDRNREGGRTGVGQRGGEGRGGDNGVKAAGGEEFERAGDVVDTDEEEDNEVMLSARGGPGEDDMVTGPPISSVGDKHYSGGAEKFLKIAHIFHYVSIAILGVFVIQVFLKFIAMGTEFLRKKMEVIDAVIIVASFVVDLVFVKGVTDAAGEEAAAVIMVFLLWRILRIINGLMLTTKKRQEFRVKLQRRARRRVDKKCELLQDDIDWHRKELTNLRNLCANSGITDDIMEACRPVRTASLSLGLSMSMMQQQMPAFLPPAAPPPSSTSLRSKFSNYRSTSLQQPSPHKYRRTSLAGVVGGGGGGLGGGGSSVAFRLPRSSVPAIKLNEDQTRMIERARQLAELSALK